MDKKFIAQISSNDEDIPILTLAMRSEVPGVVDGDDGCLEVISVECKIECQNILDITSGDIVYNIDNTLFNGDSKYFKIKLQAWGIPEGSRVCEISNLGVLNQWSICV